MEVKVSDHEGMSAMHEVQTLLYALLFGRGWKPTRQFELVGFCVCLTVSVSVYLRMGGRNDGSLCTRTLDVLVHTLHTHNSSN